MERSFHEEKLGTITATVSRYRSGWRVLTTHSNGVKCFVGEQRKTKKDAEVDLMAWTPRVPWTLFAPRKYVEINDTQHEED